MKKYLIVISLIFSTFAVSSQDTLSKANEVQNISSQDSLKKLKFCPHRINAYLGGSMTNNIYNRIHDDFVNTNYSLGAILELKYTYFFTEHWGLSVGLGIGHYAAKANLNVNGTIENYPDPDFDMYADGERHYDLSYRSDDLIEKQKIWAIEIPVQAVFEHKFGGRNGIYAGLGVKAFLPVSSKSIFDNDGKITTRGYEEFTDALYQNMPNHFGVYSYSAKTAKTKLRCSVDLQFDFGGVIGISNNTDFYLGLYGSIGFLDILPKEKPAFIEPSSTDNIKLSSLMGSNFLAEYNQANASQADFVKVREKWHLFQMGVKLGFHFKPCANNEPTVKEMQRKFYEDMAKKSNDPIIIKNTEYVYIIPSCPEGYEKDETLSPRDKDLIRDLAEALSNTKILFDLDKDIPKVSENNNSIAKIIEILSMDTTLSLQIEGYTCDLGNEEHNRDLAQRRARAVRQIFLNQGVSPSQITLKSFTVNDPENRWNIPQQSREEHRAAIIRIIKKQ